MEPFWGVPSGRAAAMRETKYECAGLRPMLTKALLPGLVALIVPLAGCYGDASNVQLQWSDHPELGMILTDSEGLTLYTFDNDAGGESTCYDTCAANWPPLTTDGDPDAASDVMGAIGTTQRDDGSTQVTYNGDPLYYFAQDDAAGQANGQGVGGIWWVVQEA